MVTPGRGLVREQGARRIRTTQPSRPGATLSPAYPQMQSAAAGGGEGPAALQSQSLRQAAPNPGARFLLPSASLPPHLPRCRAGGSAALPAGPRRGGEKGSGRSGERWQEAVRLRGPAAARERPSSYARARASPRLWRLAAGGRAELRAEEPRAERAERAAGGARGGRARASRRAGERVASPPASAVAAFARSWETDGPTDRLADRRGLSPWARGQLWRGSGFAARGFSASSRPPRLRRPRRAGGWRCGSGSPPVGPRAAQPRPGAASQIPCSPPGGSEQRCSGAPNSGCRGKCLHEPRGCPGSTTRVLKSVVASNISYLASMSYFG